MEALEALQPVQPVLQRQRLPWRGAVPRPGRLVPLRAWRGLEERLVGVMSGTDDGTAIDADAGAWDDVGARLLGTFDARLETAGG